MSRTKTRLLRSVIWAILGLVLAVSAPAGATVWDILDVGDLDHALSNLSNGDEMVLRAGTYNLDRVVALNTPNVTIRGATGVRDDVILVGGGMNVNGGVREGITIGADNVHVYDLTLSEFYYNNLHLRAENDIAGAHIRNVKTVNAGERHIKGSWDNNLNHTCDNAIIEDVYMVQTKALQNHPNLEYLAGMDIMATNNLVIRDCVAEDIEGGTATGECNAAIFLWQGHNNFTIERNVIIDCGKGIGIGLCYYPGDTISGGWHADGGAIRNNTVMRNDGTGGNNIGLELCGLKNVDVQHNTIYSPNAGYFRNLSFWDNATKPISNLDVANNIFRGGVHDIAQADWSAGAVAAMGNIVDTTGATVLPAWFVDAASGNFHLTEAATAAIDQAQNLVYGYDMDNGPRPAGSFPDYGADEFASPMGDATYDGLVDGADYTAWADHYQQSGGWGEGDFNGDGTVDGADYTAWADNYGYGVGAGGSVPEPASAALMALGLLALLRRRKG